MKALLTALTLLAISLAPTRSTGRRGRHPRDLRGLRRGAERARSAQVGALLLDSPRFLWVSDGHSVWGRKRPWHAWPLSRKRRSGASSRTSPGGRGGGRRRRRLPSPSASLVIGVSENPDRLRFLVSVLCVRTTQWLAYRRSLHHVRETGLAAAHGTCRPDLNERDGAGIDRSERCRRTAAFHGFQLQSRHSAYGPLSAARLLRAHPPRSRCLMLRSKPDVRSASGLRLLEVLSNYLRAADCDPSSPFALLDAALQTGRSFRKELRLLEDLLELSQGRIVTRSGPSGSQASFRLLIPP